MSQCHRSSTVTVERWISTGTSCYSNSRRSHGENYYYTRARRVLGSEGRDAEGLAPDVDAAGDDIRGIPGLSHSCWGGGDESCGRDLAGGGWSGL